MNDVTLAPERWLPVPAYEGYYEVSDLGRVRSLDRLIRQYHGGMRLSRGRVLKGGTYKSGHKHVTLSVDGETRTFTVHSLVMLAFVGPRPEGLEIRHLNGIPDDNCLTNLVYGTALENAEDRDDRHGRNHESNVTRCPQDHEYTTENTYVTPNGWRQCKTCRDGGRPAPPCSKCDKPAKTKGLCGTHYQELRRSKLTDEQREKIRKLDAERARQKRSNNAA